MGVLTSFWDLLWNLFKELLFKLSKSDSNVFGLANSFLMGSSMSSFLEMMFSVSLLSPIISTIDDCKLEYVDLCLFLCRYEEILDICRNCEIPYLLILLHRRCKSAKIFNNSYYLKNKLLRISRKLSRRLSHKLQILTKGT